MCPSEYETLLVCPQCGITQYPSEVRVVEIVEPGKNPRTEYHGKIRATYNRHRIYDDPSLRTFQDHPYLDYSCLVCGYTWGTPPEDPTPGGASVTFLHPVLEDEDDELVDKDAC